MLAGAANRFNHRFLSLQGPLQQRQAAHYPASPGRVLLGRRGGGGGLHPAEAGAECGGAGGLCYICDN